MLVAYIYIYFNQINNIIKLIIFFWCRACARGVLVLARANVRRSLATVQATAVKDYVGGRIFDSLRSSLPSLLQPIINNE